MPRLGQKECTNDKKKPNLPARFRAFGARAGALAGPPSAPARQGTHLAAMGLLDAPRRRHAAHLISRKNGKDLKVLHLAPMPNVSNHVSWRPLPSLPPCGKLVFWLASACVTQGPIEHRNLKHEMSQSFSYWHVMVSRPVSCRFGQCGRGSAHYLANRAQLVALVVCCEW